MVIDAGIGSILARPWPGTRTRERQINKQRGASRCCPDYSVRPRDGGTRTRVPRPRQGIRVGQEAAERSSDQAATRTDRGAAVRTGVLAALFDVTPQRVAKLEISASAKPKELYSLFWLT